MNIYTFTGRLARDSEIRHSQSGMAICSFTVAVDYGFGDNKGTNWLRCNMFGKRAEGGLPQYLIKGAQVAVSGELKLGDYTDKDGIKRTSVDVNVGSLSLLGSKQANQQQPSSQPQQHGQHPQGNAAPVDDDIPF